MFLFFVLLFFSIVLVIFYGGVSFCLLKWCCLVLSIGVVDYKVVSLCDMVVTYGMLSGVMLSR